MGGRSFGWAFRAAAVWGVVWNLFGAVSFNRAEFAYYYYQDPTQRILYQPD